MKRFKHGLSHYRLFTGDMGKLIPCGLMEVLPGDTFQHATSVLVRFSPMVAPIMHSVQVRVHHWFVPHRLTFPAWEDFITGGTDGLGNGAVIPKATLTPAAKGLMDYMGLPTGAALSNVVLMPMRAYLRIYNEHYRDQDLITEVADSNANYDIVQSIAWEKDSYTAARPWAQKGPAVSLPLGTSAPIKTGTAASGVDISILDSAGALKAMAASAATVQSTSTAGTVGGQLVADLSTATAASIIDLRRNLALQRYQEARAAYGSRYTEYLRYYGIKSSDARLQRPEYLGGGKANVSFSEVLQTGPDASGVPSDAGVGDLKGHGITALRSRAYRRFFEEHGYILSLFSVRPRTVYLRGRQRLFNRATKEDFFTKELELIGSQEIFSKEVYADGTANDENIFGYNDRYNDYRHMESGISGEFRNTLNYWHLARIFASRPTLNASFVNCDPSKRIFQDQTNHSLWVFCNHSVRARRMVTNKVIGSIR